MRRRGEGIEKMDEQTKGKTGFGSQQKDYHHDKKRRRRRKKAEEEGGGGKDDEKEQQIGQQGLGDESKE